MPPKFLGQAFRQSEQIQQLIKQSAEELSSVNTDIEYVLANNHPLPGVDSALARSKAVTS